MLDDAASFIDAAVERIGPVELFRETPWSTVWRAHTAEGPVWLKAAGAEAGLYALLVREVPDAVLHPLAVDVERGWVLLPDGGAMPNDVASALPAYARVQQTLAAHVEELLALGVADMRPAVMPERLVEAEEKTGVDMSDVRERYAETCARLAAAPGGASLDHNDLHSENVLTGARFYDWGDAVVAHPFASLLVPLEQGVDVSGYLEAYGALATSGARGCGPRRAGRPGTRLAPRGSGRPGGALHAGEAARRAMMRAKAPAVMNMKVE